MCSKRIKLFSFTSENDIGTTIVQFIQISIGNAPVIARNDLGSFLGSQSYCHQSRANMYIIPNTKI